MFWGDSGCKIKGSQRRRSGCSTMRICFYKILGVPVGASQKEIQRAFRALALRWHPDRNPQEPQASERFKEAVEAYETLGDPSRRGHYDRVRGYVKPERRSGNKRRRSGGFGGPEVVVEEILQEAFGVRRSPGAAAERRAYDLRFDLQVAMSAVVIGTYEEISYDRVVFCRECAGVPPAGRSGNCPGCGGDGEILEKLTARIWVPAGTEDGTRIRVNGIGDQPWRGCAAGDLVVVIHILAGR